MLKRSLFLIVSIVAIAVSCKEKETEKSKTETTEKSIPADTLKIRIDNRKDSMNTAWKKMMDADDQKFADIKRLLQEVTFTKSFNPVEINKLNALADSVKGSRYTAENMTSEKIDNYDKATENLISQVYAVVQKNPEMPAHSITETLIQDISKAENEVVNHRIVYDRWAKEYNHLLDTQKSALQQLGEPYSSYQKRPLFELPS
jgi:hypothetical protein